MARILFIGDDKENEATQFEWLKEDGHQIVLAQDGEQALQLLTIVPVDLVVTNSEQHVGPMPDYLQEMLVRHRHLKVILLTGDRRRQENTEAWCEGRLWNRTTDELNFALSVFTLLSASQTLRYAEVHR